jgi:hypothetical protein
MDLLARAVATREATKQSNNALLVLPDSELDLLAAAISDKNDNAVVRPALGTERAKLLKALAEISANLDAMKATYDPMAAQFAHLASQFLVDEALAGDSSSATAAGVEDACLAQHTKLVSAAAARTVDLATLTVKTVREKKAEAGRREAFESLRQRSLLLLQDFEQRRLACPEIRDDEGLISLLDALRINAAAAGS